MPPQHGLYTAIVGGILIALTGGSRFNVSGPTAAFVVILDLSDITMMDMTAIVALESIVEDLRERGIFLIVCGLSPRILQKLERTTVREADGVLAFAGDMDAAVGVASGYSPRLANGTA